MKLKWVVLPLLAFLSTHAFAALESREETLLAAQKSKDAKDFKKAQNIYEEWLRTHPDDHEVEFWYAQVLSWQKDYFDAEEIYTRLLEINPQHRDADFARAQLWSWESHFQKSLARLDDLLALEPNNSEFRAERDRVLKAIAETRAISTRLGFDFKSYNFFDKAALGLKASFSYAQTGWWAARGGVYGVTKFAETTAQIAAGGSYWLTPNWVLDFDGDFSTHSDILPLFSFSAGTNVTIARAITPGISIQLSQYTGATVLTFIPTVSWAIVPSLELTAKLYASYTSFDSTRSAGTVSGYVKLNYAPFDYFSVNLGTAAGEEPFDPGNPSMPLGSYFAQNLFGGFKFTVDGHFGADLSFNQEWRSNANTVFAGEFALFYNW